MEKRSICIIALVGLMAVLWGQGAFAATFDCEIRTSCLASQTLLARLNSSASTQNNSHAQLANYSGAAYPYSICCATDAFRTLSNQCSGTSAAVLKLASMTNSHVQAGTQSGYQWDACYNVTSGTIECEYPNDTCSAGYSEVVSIASSEPSDSNLTNAHVGEFPLYMRKVCCRIGGQNPPTIAYADITPINTTTRLDLQCLNGTTSDPDGDSVTLHYNWLRNGASITVLNLPMDYDSSTGETHDISGFANHGTVNGATFLPTGGQVGGAFSFDGIDDYVQIAEDTTLAFSDEYSFTSWVRASLPGPGKYHMLFWRGVEGQSDIEVYVQQSTNDLVIVHNRNNGGGFDWVAYEDPPDDQWYHLTVTYDGSQTDVYYDGLPQSVVQQTDDLAKPLSSASFFVRLGNANHSIFSPTWLEGELDETLIFNRSLSAEEVRTLYATNNRHFNSTELVRGETWNCSITPVDSTGLNGSTVFSNETYVDGSLPIVPTLLYPIDGNQSVFERFVNFDWTASDERDGDAVTYRFNLSVEPGSCATETQVTGIPESNYTFGALCFDQIYRWNVTACDDVEGCSSTTSTFNFTVASILSITLVNNAVEFGSLAQGQNIYTDNYSVLPFLIENDGNVLANVSLRGNSSPFVQAGLDGIGYRFRVQQNESGSFVAAQSQTSYIPVPSADTHAIKHLNFTDGNDLAAIHINLTVPGDEPPGQKEANITFQGVMDE